MKLLPLAAVAISLETVLSQEVFLFPQIVSSETLVWIPCGTGTLCARLDVPLDYSNPNGSFRASIPLIKLPALTNALYKGILLTNPGGPGGSGISFVGDSGALLQQVVGEGYDIISWDPRGVGEFLPSADCSAPATNSTILTYRGVKDVPKINLAQAANISEATVVIAADYGKKCQQTIGQLGGIAPFSGTADTARDMISILDAYVASNGSAGVESPELLNYWGFSYGTFLGQTFASLFPDRIGKVAIDGVVDPEEYISGLNRRSVLYQDDVFALFFSYCNAAGPSLCTYYTGSTPEDIYNRFENSVQQLDIRQAMSQNWSNASLINTALTWVHANLFQANYQPNATFPLMSDFLEGLEMVLLNFTDVNVETWMETNDLTVNLELPTTIDEILAANVATGSTIIACADQQFRSFGMSLAELQPNTDELEHQSVIAGELLAIIRASCTQWPILGRNIYSGPFGGRTKNPMLFVSNTFDPITPIDDGRKWVGEFEDAQLLTSDSAGHTTIDAQNLCAFAKINAFFQNGTLPGQENFCPTEAGPFGVTLAGGLAKRSEVSEITKMIKSLRSKLSL